jgi:hypothetical protein
MVLRAALAFALLASSCVGDRVFECASANDCLSAEGVGFCEPTLRCSFTDDECASGHRYGGFAGALSGQCTDGPARDAGPDAPLADADPLAPDAPPVPDADPTAIDARIADAAETPDATETPDARPTPDAQAGQPDGGIVATRCGATTMLADNFNDGVLGAQWGYNWEDPGASWTETGGRIVFTPPMNASGYAGILTPLSYDIREGAVSIVVTGFPSTTAGTVEAQFILQTDSGDAQISASGGQIHFSDGSTTIGSVTFNTTNHRVWRFRESGGTLTWEVGDGVNFPFSRSRVSIIDPSLVRVLIDGGSYGNQANPGTISFDDVNGGTASGAWCPTNTLKDAFSDSVRQNVWGESYTTGTGCVMTEGAGHLAITPPSTSGYCVYRTSTLFRLDESDLTVEVPQMVDTSKNTTVFMQVVDPDDDALQIAQEGGTLKLRTQDEPFGPFTQLGAVAYNPTTDRWWRIREAGGNVSFQTSPTGAAGTWTTRATTPTGSFDANAARIEFGVGASSSITAPGTAWFDNFNLTP